NFLVKTVWYYTKGERQMAASRNAAHEKTYSAIIKFYDLAEELIDTVVHEGVADPVRQLQFVEPLVEQLESATDVLAEEYRHFVKTGQKPNAVAKQRVEEALAKIDYIVNRFRNTSVQ